jgi:hypothetical protein
MGFLEVWVLFCGSTDGDIQRFRIQEHDGDGQTVDGHAQKNTGSTPTKITGFAVPVVEHFSEAGIEIVGQHPADGPFNGKNPKKQPEAGAEDNGQSGNNAKLSGLVGTCDQSSRKTGGGDRDGGKADNYLSSHVKGVQLTFHERKEWVYFPTQTPDQLSGFVIRVSALFHSVVF